MPVPWFTLPPLPQSKATLTKVDTELTVEARQAEYDNVSQTYTFKEGVVATYGVTRITADELVLDAKIGVQRGRARGNVLLVDPDGTARAQDIEFSWARDNRFGRAENAEIDFAGVLVRAKVVDIRPELWTLEDVYGTVCRQNPPVFAVRAPKVTLIPGRRGRVHRPRLEIFGKPLLTVPSQSFNLDRRTQGFRIPQIAYRKDQGFGANWESGFLIGPSTALTTSISSFKGSRPSYGVQVGRSRVPESAAGGLIVPINDFNERFAFSYWDNVEQQGPGGEYDYVHEARDSVGLSSQFHIGNPNQTQGREYSKPLEVVYERGGDFGAFGAVGQARLQGVQEELGPVKTRLMLSGTVMPDPVVFQPNLLGWTRLDAATYLGANTNGWIRAQMGATYQPVRWFTASAGIHRSARFGTPDFQIDDLLSPQGAVARMDLNLGPTQATIMHRYDTRRGWYDRQYMVRQVVGCFEPFIVYRQFAGDYRFGLNIRIGRFQEVISRRDFRRDGNVPRIIDGPGRRRENE